MSTFRYSEWDGSQQFPDIDPDELMDELGRNLMAHGDVEYAMRLMEQHGFRDSQGRKMPSIQQLLDRLRQKKQKQLEKYNLGSMMDEMRKRLTDILKTERTGIDKKLNEARRRTEEGGSDLDPEIQQKLLQRIEEMANQNIDKLNALPDDFGGRIRELSTNYDFMDEDARNKFKELMDMLKKQAMESYGRDLVQQFKDMDPARMAEMRHFVEALNQMLEKRMRGEDPEFDKFMQEFGHYFGDNPPKDLDELIERLQQQIAQAQSLMDSLAPEDREELEDMLSSMLDDATQYELAKMSAALEMLYPSEQLRQRYSFSGEESVSYDEAMKLMEEMQKIDELEDQLEDSRYDRSLDNVDEQLMKELMDEESMRELKQLKEISKALEQAGYITKKDGRYELTPRGMRKIGQKALQDIFAQLRKDRIGGHTMEKSGGGGERLEETRPWEWGDDFNLHLQKTVMNAIHRGAGKPPVQLKVDDFEVYLTEEMTRSATIILLDLSLSMPMRGNFEAAKRVTLALDGLIRSQFPKDSLRIVGFSSYAREIKKEDLTVMGWDEFDPYTNMQHGLHVARKLLDKERSNNKQIILISDGEPTAHFENERLYFQYPPSMRTIQMTLREVKKCTQKGITINTFMLDEGHFVGAFVQQMARINKGRVFYTGPDRLGQYLLVDYLSNKKKRL